MTGVPVRPASTVMLVRDQPTGLEVFTLRRVREMAFAGGMTAFPGGGVDPTDADPDVPWIGPEPGWWAAQWAIGEAEARARVVAAVRELFEETGLLLAGSDAEVVGDPDRLEDQRQAVTAHSRSLAAVLRVGGYPLRADLLRPWARWITPEGQPRRYDTYFFVAALPEGTSPRALTTEAVDGAWARPAALMAAVTAGSIGMMPPTRAMITDLGQAVDVAALLATPRSVTPVTPVVVSRDGEVRVMIDGIEVATMPTGAMPPPSPGSGTAVTPPAATHPAGPPPAATSPAGPSPAPTDPR
jgi:8-oxo-dGTP pyrophosphatase MutT (NUDIX family)